jgi:predicted ATPase/DNA-binding CsgD family transcriptional regulator
LTRCLGRSWEIDEIKRNLRETRLLTLTGAGGSGKTRLAIEVAQGLIGTFADGIIFVDLAPISDPELILPTLSHALDVPDTPFRPPLAALAEHVGQREILLVLDNFEHLLSAASVVVDVLEAAPRVKALVTSRAMLRVSGEYCFPVPPLLLPDSRQATREVVEETPATALFVERARAVRPEFVVTNENAALVAEICARLDGLPLAIELAAARCRHLALATLLDRLEHRLTILSGGPRDRPTRQQTLRATIGWSYDLLKPAERLLFRRLGVFVGGFTLEGVEAVAGDESGESAIDLMSGLLDQSMLGSVDRPFAATRYVMLETIRELAVELLHESEEEVHLRQRHAAFYVRLAEQAEPNLEGADQARWLNLLEAEHENIRAALRWLIDQDQQQLAQRLAGSIWMFWFIRGYVGEGRRWLAEALATENADADNRARAKALNAAAALARWQSDNLAARAFAAESLARYRTVADRSGESAALDNLGWVAIGQGDYAAAASLYQEHLALNQALANAQGTGEALSQLAIIARRQGKFEQARALFAEARAIWAPIGDTQALSWVALQLGEIALEVGDHDDARAAFDEHRRLVHEIGHRQGIADSLVHAGKLAYYDGDHQEAVTLLGQARALLRDLGDPPDAVDSFFWHARAVARNGDIDRAATLFEEGVNSARARGDRRGLVLLLEGIAALELARGNATKAARILGAADATRDELGLPIPPVERGAIEQAVSEARAALGAASFAAAWSTGRTDRAQVLGLTAPSQPETMARDPNPEDARQPSVKSGRRYPDGLTDREAIVLARLAEGKSSREIADELVLSTRTVERHIANIYAKIGARGRADAATYAVRNHLVPT